MLPPKIVLATHNKGKIAEFQVMFDAFDVTIIGADSIGLPEPDETEDTFEGNALLKARHACDITAMPCLADDSGLCVTALDGAPGIYSARWAGDNKDFDMAMKKVWDDIAYQDNMSAQFVAVLALVMPDEKEFVARGEVQGEISYPPRGEHGFGYDPIFVPTGENQTFAELGKAGKEKHSHRKHAFMALMGMMR